MSNVALLARIRKRREHTVDLGEGKKISFLRPPEIDFPNFLVGEDGKRNWVVKPDDTRKYVCGWSGFTEADLIGDPSIASSDPVDFDADIWAEVCADRLEWQQKLGRAILDSVLDHINKRADVEKNSSSDSTANPG